MTVVCTKINLGWKGLNVNGLDTKTDIQFEKSTPICKTGSAGQGRN